MSERIAAIVISYNRLAEMRGCIEALRRQTRPLDQIVVADNGSTDGSREWLATQPDVHTILQGNIGCGGALRVGMEYAVRNRFDWAWCFDDDAHADPGALQALCDVRRTRPQARVLNSLSVSRADPSRFAVGAVWVRTEPDDFRKGFRAATVAELRRFADAEEIVDTIGGQFYHGALIHREVIETVGRPLPWMFTWGDEIEYGYRIMRAGYPILSVLCSVVQHPEIPFASLKMLGKTKAFEVRPPLSRYYSIRNSLWIHRTYFHAPLLSYVARRLGGAFLAELFIIPGKTLRERLDACAAALRGVRDGLRLEPARDANGNPILA